LPEQKIIGITMGDAAGVGPEVVARALANIDMATDWRALVIGDSEVMIKAMALVGNRSKLIAAGDNLQLNQNTDVLNILDLKNLSFSEVEIGKTSAACGKASVEYIIRAAQLALHHKIDAIVTAPINKESTTLAGFGELGHLELLAHYTDTKEYATMLVSDNLRVVHLTTHYSLKEAVRRVKKELILARLKLAQKFFNDWGYSHPIIGVAALNPHGGEHGIMGNEELEEIVPAMTLAKEFGIDARGPFPADTIFNRALKGEFDVVIAMYHDQGHIPIKVHNVQKSVSIALGLPFIRTSVDHGTAFDIAWKGIADAVRMQEAIKQAVVLVRLKESQGR
jgi:4-hydroxythreonine-4-phosphate dehydrogenase